MLIHRRALARLFVGFGFTAVAPAAFAQGKTVAVAMKQAPKGAFVPQTVNISAGDTIKWTNPGFVVHSVTFDPSKAQTAGDVVLPAGVASFDSPDIEEDGTFSHTFTTKGTYKYVCKYHEAMGMIGTVIVS